jgi:hypothetical protein
MEQPPSASADSNSVPTANALVFRSTHIGPEVPFHAGELYSRRTLISSGAAALFKPLSPETIKPKQ